ncbi:penicillin-binding transpeptidase domain-containing protein, partial [Methylobacterium nigriterrae]|uniref:penicillin-binding transpeptidase domain-containing protein n=1 Tax=Methylobacterium nigriterrae TaxID=3127512 RepID=UPI003D67EA6D
MTAAYTTVANGGYRAAPTGVLAVVDGRGQVRASFLEPLRTRVIPQRCIGPTQTVLREVVRSGTGRHAALGRWAAYGKTGTSTGYADAWFVGWSEGRVLGVWMGRCRDAEGEGLAGKGAPAEFFRRVEASANGMMADRAAGDRNRGLGKVVPAVIAGAQRPAPGRGREHPSAQANLAPRTARRDAAELPPLP